MTREFGQGSVAIKRALLMFKDRGELPYILEGLGKIYCNEDPARILEEFGISGDVYTKSLTPEEIDELEDIYADYNEDIATMCRNFSLNIDTLKGLQEAHKNLRTRADYSWRIQNCQHFRQYIKNILLQIKLLEVLTSYHEECTDTTSGVMSK